MRRKFVVTEKWDEQVTSKIGETMAMKKPSKPTSSRKSHAALLYAGMTIGIDLGDVWSHYCTLNEDGKVVDQGRFRTTLAGVKRRGSH